MKIESYKKLTVWQKSVTLVEEVYKITSLLPNSEKYSLADQMNRSAISIPSNIAEGSKRAGLGDYIRFLMISAGSAAELDTQIYILKRRYPNMDTSMAESLLLEVQKMLSVLTKNLKSKTYDLRPKNGFTLIEVLVAASLFTIVMGIVVGAFIKSLQAQKQITSLISANSNAGLAIEQLSREIRTGKGFCQDEIACMPMPDGSFQKLIFTSAGQTIAYNRTENNNIGALFKKLGSESGASLTSEDVDVRRLAFYLQGHRPGTQETPKVTIILQIGTAEKSFQGDIINLQTTVSSRVQKGE